MKEICRGLGFPEGPIAMDDGSVILVEIERGTLSQISSEGVLTVIAQCGGGPNGAGVGPDGRIYVCNNGGFEWVKTGEFRRPGDNLATDYQGGSIQVVDRHTGTVETLYTECAGRPLNGPNDIVFDAEGGFYFTDLGKRRGRRIDRGAIYYARADGSQITELIYPSKPPTALVCLPTIKPSMWRRPMAPGYGVGTLKPRECSPPLLIPFGPGNYSIALRVMNAWTLLPSTARAMW